LLDETKLRSTAVQKKIKINSTGLEITTGGKESTNQIIHGILQLYGSGDPWAFIS
jgi:hypothetical protein